MRARVSGGRFESGCEPRVCCFIERRCFRGNYLQCGWIPIKKNKRAVKYDLKRADNAAKTIITRDKGKFNNLGLGCPRLNDS